MFLSQRAARRGAGKENPRTAVAPAGAPSANLLYFRLRERAGRAKAMPIHQPDKPALQGAIHDSVARGHDSVYHQ